LPSHDGVQHDPATQLLPSGHEPVWQVPPQVSSAPQALPSQRGWQQVPPTQRTPGAHDGLHAQLSMQVPALQSWPAGQWTPAHGLVVQRPARQLWPVGHWTPAHGSGLTQVALHANPSGQLASHAASAWQVPSAGEQYEPLGHVTPAQRT
jgi:hypothetical protein